MGDLEPITRNEKLWSGEDLTPVTRREMYIKHLYDETQVIPEYPVTREEMFILKAGEELHDVTIEQLTATENKTYSEEGVAYSPVIVNVPLPSNAYLLKELEDVEIASFNDGSDLPMPKLEVAIEPVQDLHGYDAPWVGGSGKNLIPMTVADVKSANTSGTWSGNSYVYGGITYTIQTDSGGNVTGINANGTSTSSYSPFYLSSQMNVESGKEYIINGSPQSPSSSTWRLWVESSTAFPSGNRLSDDTVGDSRRTAMANETVSVYIQIFSGQILSNKMFYPMIRLASVTDATFAPYSNICPISGWDEVNVGVSGVNVWDEEWELDANYRLSSKNYIPVKPNTEYIFCNTYLYSITAYDENKNSLGSVSLRQVPNVGYKFTTPSNCYFIKFKVGNSYGTTYNNDISINYPSTDTSYHAYNGHTYTLDLDGTRYGGKVDLVSGVMTVDRVGVDMGDLTWALAGSSGATRFETNMRSYNPLFPTNPANEGNIICSQYKNYAWNVAISASSTIDGAICAFQVSDNDKRIGIKDSRYTSASDFKTAMNGVQLVYELATPITIQLTPTVVKSLKGKNNVYADSGNILDLSYLAKEE